MLRASLVLLDLLKLAACLAAINWIWQGRQAGRWNTLASVAIVVICLLPNFWLFYIFFTDAYNNFNDFRNAYHPAGRAVLDDLAALGPLVGRAKFVNLPIVAYLFAPFGLLPLPLAAGIYTLLGVGAVVWAWALLCRMAQLDERRRWLLLVLFAGFGPLIYSFKEGNTTHVVLPAIVGGLLLLRERRDIAAGLLLGVISVIKLPLLLFGAYFLLRRNWAAVAGFVAVWAAACLVSLAVFGWDLNWQWFELCVWQSSANVVGAYNMQSIAGFLARLAHDPGILRDWVPYPPSVAARLLASGIVVLLYGAAVWASAKGGSNDETGGRRDLEYCLVLALATVSSPLSWVHYYSWFLIPIAFVLGARPPFALGAMGVSIAWIAIFMMAPMVLYINFFNPAVLWLYAKLAVSHTLFGGLIFVSLLIWAQAKAAVAYRPAVGARA